MRTGTHITTAEAIREVLACNKLEIDEKKEGWDPQVPGLLLGGLLVRGCRWGMVA